MHNIYLDHNATTPLDSAIWGAMSEYAHAPLNPSSVHGFGRKAHSVLEESRQRITQTLNAHDKKVVFTATGTEANNLALRGLENMTVFVSAVEHDSVLKIPNVNILAVDAEGVVDVHALEEALQACEDKALVSVMLANNETGVIQPIAEISRIAHEYGALVHSDAVQGLGKIPVDVDALGVDMLTISGHKCYGPQGAAALLLNKSLQLKPLYHGGGQEHGMRAGTQNLLAIIGLAEVVAKAPERLKHIDHITMLRDRLEERVVEHGAKVFGKDASRLPNTSCLSMPKVEAQTQLIHFDMRDIAVSAGSACSSGKVETSHVLKAMGVGDEASNAIRISLGETNTEQEVDIFIDAWEELYSRIAKPLNQPYIPPPLAGEVRWGQVAETLPPPQPSPKKREGITHYLNDKVTL